MQQQVLPFYSVQIYSKKWSCCCSVRIRLLLRYF